MLTALTPLDDSLHAGPVDDLFWTETMWLSFAVPERRLTGVTYVVLRPNQKVASLGVWLWDDTGSAETDGLYFQNYPHLPAPRDIGDMDLPCGFRQRVIEPGHRYQVSYDDGTELRLDLAFESFHGAIGREFDGTIAGSNQLGRVTGTIDFNEQHIVVDCPEFRGRSWSSRGDARLALRPDAAGEMLVHSDTYAISAATSFFASTMGTLACTDIVSGHISRDGEPRAIIEGQRYVVRNPVRGYPDQVVVEATDDAGRTVSATGTCVNHLLMATAPGVPVSIWVCGTNWVVDGEPGWGQDQDVPLGRPEPHIAEPRSE